MASGRRVEFSAADGTKLRGVLYLPDEKNAPAVIITSRLTFLTEHHMARVAQRFQAAGIAGLVYDHPSWGSSDGLPRQSINLFTQAFDWSDAITFLSGQSPDIDPSRVGVLGAGHGGGVAMQVAAADSRAKVAVSIVSEERPPDLSADPSILVKVFALPFFSGFHDSQFWPKGYLERAYKEQAQRADSGGRLQPTYTPIFHDSLEDAKEDSTSRLIGGESAYRFYQNVKQMSDRAGTPWEKKVTLDSLRYQRVWEPSAYLPQTTEKPVLWVLAEMDEFTPAEKQEQAFATIHSPKKQILNVDSGNLQVFQAPQIFDQVIEKEIAFLNANL